MTVRRVAAAVAGACLTIALQSAEGARAQAAAPAESARAQAASPAREPAARDQSAVATAARPARAREAVAELGGAGLFYIDTGGSGPAVVLLHAGTGSVPMWEVQVSAFAEAGYRVIAYDRRGHGRTTVQPDAPAGTAADDLEALVKHLGLERFHLIGTAAGGMVATDYVQSFPDRLLSVVIANSLVGVQDEEYLALGRRLRPKEFSTLPPDFRELGPAYRAANPEGTARWLEIEHASRPPGPRPPAQTWKNKTTFKSLEGIKTPTLLITGDADLYTPPHALRLFAERIKHAETLLLREVGHSAYWEQPDLFNRAVLAFIAKHSPRRSAPRARESGVPLEDR